MSIVLSSAIDLLRRLRELRNSTSISCLVLVKLGFPSQCHRIVHRIVQLGLYGICRPNVWLNQEYVVSAVLR